MVFFAFAVAEESSAHLNFKQHILKAQKGGTKLKMKNLVPVRLLQDDFFEAVSEAEANGSSEEERLKLLGKSRAKLGMFEGDLAEGELEIKQVSAMLSEIQPATEILSDICRDAK